MFTCQWWQEIMELFRFKVNELKFIVLLKFIVATTAGTPALCASKKIKRMILLKRLILIVIIVFSFHFLKGQTNEVIEGTLIQNFTELEGFYGLEDSIVETLKDTINKLNEMYDNTEEVKTFNEDYEFLKKNKLLYTPCHFIKLRNKRKIRVYVSEKLNDQINNLSWYKNMKSNKLFTEIKIRGNKLKEGTFFGDSLIESSVWMLEDMEEDIPMPLKPYSYIEIENLYLAYHSTNNKTKIISDCERLINYFTDLSKKENPFDVYIDPTISELQIDTTILNQFLKEMKLNCEKK